MANLKASTKSFMIFALLAYGIFLGISFFYEVSTILSLRSPRHSSYNFGPFTTITKYLFNIDQYNLSTWLYNMVGNVLIFFPLGLLTPYFLSTAKKYMHVMFISLFVSGSIEIFQYFTSLGVMDIDDIILNLTGSTMGYGLYRIITYTINKR
ncbi:VanZ family protein [Thalassobacillus sp. CUG 92003]|uniref:VanZ family protein n=1 Tax=Thalassobacillus sp. CUG 92003 TaxID=2736641 RepID=UPI0015E7BDB4|nr:VanZ family protein [Thalassobacillus sp. CUG 92003]